MICHAILIITIITILTVGITEQTILYCVLMRRPYAFYHYYLCWMMIFFVQCFTNYWVWHVIVCLIIVDYCPIKQPSVTACTYKLRFFLNCLQKLCTMVIQFLSYCSLGHFRSTCIDLCQALMTFSAYMLPHIITIPISCWQGTRYYVICKIIFLNIK